jgi:hypothetical protein
VRVHRLTPLLAATPFLVATLMLAACGGSSPAPAHHASQTLRTATGPANGTTPQQLIPFTSKSDWLPDWAVTADSPGEGGIFSVTVTAISTPQAYDLPITKRLRPAEQNANTVREHVHGTILLEVMAPGRWTVTARTQ